MPDQTSTHIIESARQYVQTRDDMIKRYQGAGGALLGNASKPTQITFINMMNHMANKFASELPTMNLIEWEGLSELCSTYLATLRLKGEKK